MSYYLAVDIGTTSVKAVAFNDQGEIISRHSCGYEMRHPQKNFSEQDADEIYAAVIASINKTLEELLPRFPLFLSFSAMMHSLIAVDQQGKPLTSCMIWADNRAAEIAEALRKGRQGQEIYRATGVPVHAMSPLCKLLWLKANEPDIFNTANKFIGIKEYVFFKIFNEYVVDTAIASATGLLNIQSLLWDENVLHLADISAGKLSTLVQVERVFSYQPGQHSSEILNLQNQTPFVIGGSDGALANLGAGSVTNDSISVTIGTSAAVRLLSPKPILDEAMSLFCYHANRQQFIVGGASNNGAVVIEWLKDSILESDDSFEALLELAHDIPAGVDGLILIPYILGERAPVWNSEAKAVFFGLTVSHTKAHLVRAAMEGITYNAFSIAKPVLDLAPVKAIYAAGGFARSEFWLQMLADVFNCTVLVSGSPESSALGAVMVGLQAMDIPLSIQPEIISEHHPDINQHLIYQHNFQKFERLYTLLKGEFNSVPNVPTVLSD